MLSFEGLLWNNSFNFAVCWCLLDVRSHLFSCLPLDIIDNTAEHERVLVADEDQERLLTIAATCLSQQNELKLVDVVNVEWGKSQI